MGLVGLSQNGVHWSVLIGMLLVTYWALILSARGIESFLTTHCPITELFTVSIWYLHRFIYSMHQRVSALLIDMACRYSLLVLITILSINNVYYCLTTCSKHVQGRQDMCWCCKKYCALVPVFRLLLGWASVLSLRTDLFIRFNLRTSSILNKFHWVYVCKWSLYPYEYA